MGRALSNDLRQRLIFAVEQGSTDGQRGGAAFRGWPVDGDWLGGALAIDGPD